VSVRNTLSKLLWKWLAPVAALATACVLYFHSPGHRSYGLTLTAGNALGARHRLAERLQKYASEQGLTFAIDPSQGSEQALDWVNERKADVALVQGALAAAGRPHVRQVASLNVEALHLAVKRDLAARVSANLMALGGKTLDLGEPGSGTQSLALAILEFVGLQPRDRDPVHGHLSINLDRQHLFGEQDASRLPDAIFLVASLPSSTTRYLVTQHGYRLVPLPFAEALALEWLEKSAAEDQPGAGPGEMVLGRLQATTIPAYTYGIEPPVPATDLPTLGTRLLLVAHKNVPARAMSQLVEATYGSEFAQLVHPRLEARLLDLPPEFPWHAGALLYQQRNAPLLSGAVMDSAHKAFAIFAAAASGLFVLWQWTRLSGNTSRTRGFKDYLAQVTRIEERLLAAEQGEPLALADLFALRGRLCRLKSAALDDFAAADLAGKDLLLGFLLQVNDVRDYLTRLILHREATETRVD
jgi:TRAP-type uncharacterized transport system substrate-binding protein